MRIIGGSLKGRNLKVPAKIEARPTTDMAREALFSVLEHYVELEGLEVLDLFAGTGSVSLEFLSRGASHVTAVDISQASRIFLTKTIKEWDLKNLKFARQDVFKLANRANAQFDLVFADPPYGHARFAEIPEIVLGSGWVKPGGIFILEHGGRIDLPHDQRVFLEKTYGSVNFRFYKMGRAPEDAKKT
jgi:16S rRNA (guanine(966)-N(2))-methyltransferase RsmD